MLKGLACVLMLIGHAIRVKMHLPGVGDKIFLYIMDFSGPIFFFVSGMNVMTFLERNRNKPGFQEKRFYLAAAVLLFFLGYTYNINRASFLFCDIFQGVALCTIVVFLLMRTKLPTAAHFIIMIAFFALYTQFRVRLQLDRISGLENFTSLKNQLNSENSLVEYIPVLREFMRQLGPIRRFLFVHFSLLPWVVFFYTGALTYRSITMRGRSTKPWWALFATLFALGPIMHLVDRGRVFPQMFLDSYLDLMLRCIPSYVFMTLGGAGLAYLLSRKIYPGAANTTHRFGKWLAVQIERLGKESLLFLIVHWWVIASVRMPTEMHNWMVAVKRLPGPPRFGLNIYLRSALVLVVVMLLIPLLARLRDRWSRTRFFVPTIVAVMVISILLAFVLIFLGGPALGNYATYGTSFGFAFLYPHLRGKLRRKYTLPTA